MSSKVWLIFICGFIGAQKAIGQSPRVVAECTITYSLSVESSSGSSEMLQSLNGASKIIYIKGTKSRNDLVSPSYSLTVLSDTKSDTTIILRQIGNSRYMSFLNEEKKLEKNKKFEGIVFTPTGQSKTILGYLCKQVEAKLKDGSAYNVFYAPSVIPSNRDYEYQFRDLPGLALEYETESEDGKAKFKFTAEKITLTPVLASKFDLPKSGYRIL